MEAKAQFTHFAVSVQLLDQIVVYLKTRPWGEVDGIMQQIRVLEALAPTKEEKQDEPKPPDNPPKRGAKKGS